MPDHNVWNDPTGIAPVCSEICLLLADIQKEAAHVRHWRNRRPVLGVNRGEILGWRRWVDGLQMRLAQLKWDIRARFFFTLW